MVGNFEERAAMRIVFHKVKAHLLKQNKRSLGFDETCRYRGVDGTSCAIGCLITDEAYDPDIEGIGMTTLSYDDNGWYGVGANFKGVKLAQALNKSNIPVSFNMWDMLCDLQRLHDRVLPKDWARSLDAEERIWFSDKEESDHGWKFLGRSDDDQQ